MPDSTRKRNAISLLFAGFVVVWSVQFMFHELISESWPSLTFPRFGRVGGDYAAEPRHYFLQEVIVHDASGQTHTVAPDELFAPVPYNRGALYGRQFSPTGSAEAEDDEPAGLLRRIHAWPGERMEALLADIPPFTNYYRGRDGQPRGNTPESRAWLEGLLAQWRPGESFERVEFVWYGYEGHTLGTEVDDAQMTKDTYVVELR